MEIRKISRRCPRSLDEAGHFTLLFAEDGKEMYTKIYNARAQLFVCSLNLLFSDVHVPAVLVICVSSLRELRNDHETMLSYLAARPSLAPRPLHIVIFFLPDRRTHLHEREVNGKRNILWG